MSSAEELKQMYSIVKMATAALDEKRQHIAQEKQALDALKADMLDAVRQLNRLPLQITDNVTSAVKNATAQVAPAVARDLKGHLNNELEAPLASAKTHIANAAKVEQRLVEVLDGFGQRLFLRAGAVMAVIAFAALLVMFIALYWQRSTLTDLMSQKAQLQAEIPQLQATAFYLKKHGGNVQYTTCNDPDGAKHICFMIKTDHYYGNSVSGLYAVPVGD